MFDSGFDLPLPLGGKPFVGSQSAELNDLRMQLHTRLTRLHRIAGQRSIETNKNLEEFLHTQELKFYEHTLRRFEANMESKDAVQSLSGKFALISTLQQALAN